MEVLLLISQIVSHCDANGLLYKNENIIYLVAGES